MHTHLIFLVIVCWRCVNAGAHVLTSGTSHSMHGVLIDAGSSGSRIHVFSWHPRVFEHLPIPVTIPLSSGARTTRIQPGIHSFVDSNEHSGKLDLSGLEEHLLFLITYAKNQLLPYEESWGTFPLYLFASGGVRAISPPDRSLLMRRVRSLLGNKTLCPFRVQADSVRVLSGEEEGVFAWAAANFLHHRLTSTHPVPTSERADINTDTADISSSTSPLSTYGSFNLGASSSQVTFIPSDRDISEGLFRLQLGQRHWDLYTKSFLLYGYDAARERHLQQLASQTISHLEQPPKAVVPRALDYCLFAGYSEGVAGQMDSGSVWVEVHGPAVPAEDQMQRCAESLRGLLRTGGGGGDFCQKVYGGECGMGGVYQPPLPQNPLSEDKDEDKDKDKVSEDKDEDKVSEERLEAGGGSGHFIGSGSYKYPWKFLQMPATATLAQFKTAATDMCSKSFNDIVLYDATLTYMKAPKHSTLLPYYCFLSSYILVLLEDGHGFTAENTLSAQEEVQGDTVGWAYGAMLYEVNALPFKLKEPDEVRLLGRLLLAWSTGVVAGVLVVGGVLGQFLFRPHQRPSQGGQGQGQGQGQGAELAEGHGQGQNSNSSARPAKAATSSLYHDLARIYNGGNGGSGGGPSGARSGAAAEDISQYSPFANQAGTKETSSLLTTRRSRGTISVDSNTSSTDTVNVLRTEKVKTDNNNYQSI